MPVKSRFSFLFLLLISASCFNEKEKQNFENVDFNEVTNTLTINFNENPDKSLQQIISVSEIRKNGYGVLLNINQSISGKDLDLIKLKLRKLDINAVHDFHVNGKLEQHGKIRSALRGAKFIWVFDSNNSLDQDKTLRLLKEDFNTAIESGAVMVKNGH